VASNLGRRGKKKTEGYLKRISKVETSLFLPEEASSPLDEKSNRLKGKAPESHRFGKGSSPLSLRDATPTS